MTVTIYKSTDASAPALSGSLGSFIALLDAILVNGYGSKAAQGWSKTYTGTNAASYQAPVGTNRRWLDVNDNGGSGNNFVRVVGYESMTALATGTNPFPNPVTQVSGGLYVCKSSAADATARPWYCYANGKIFYLWIAADNSIVNPQMHGLIFGDFTSYVPSDVYNTIIIAGTAASITINATQNHIACMSCAAFTTAPLGHYVCRNFTGVGSSAVIGKVTNTGIGGCQFTSSNQMMMGNLSTKIDGTGASAGGVPYYPNPADGAMLMERLWLPEINSVLTIRGELPGLWAPLHNVPLAHLDTFSGSGALSGKTFEVLRSTSASVNGEWFMETSNTW